MEDPHTPQRLRLQSPLSAEKIQARQILDATGVHGGLIVHLGCGDGRLTAALRATDAYLVHGLDADARQRRGRAAAYPVARPLRQGLGRPLRRPAAAVYRQPREPDCRRETGLASTGGNAAGAGARRRGLRQDRGRVDEDWSSRGRRRSTSGPTTCTMPSNNAVAHDAAVGPPRHLQWVCGPAWSRHHDHMASLSAMVSARGRIFYIMDEGPREAILLPSQWSLIARDAFNGTILWKRPIAEWNTQLWPLKSGPNQLPRRLVAVGDRVYVTLGIDAPLTALDAATGQTLRTYPGTRAHRRGASPPTARCSCWSAHAANKWKEYRPKFTYVWANTQRANKEWAWDQGHRSLMAVDADDGRGAAGSKNSAWPR